MLVLLSHLVLILEVVVMVLLFLLVLVVWWLLEAKTTCWWWNVTQSSDLSTVEGFQLPRKHSKNSRCNGGGLVSLPVPLSVCVFYFLLQFISLLFCEFCARVYLLKWRLFVRYFTIYKSYKSSRLSVYTPRSIETFQLSSISSSPTFFLVHLLVVGFQRDRLVLVGNPIRKKQATDWFWWEIHKEKEKQIKKKRNIKNCWIFTKKNLLNNVY